MKTLKTQLVLLATLRCIRMFLISMPVIVIYWQDHGLGMQDIFFLQVIFSVALVIFEIPSGYFADVVGNRNALIIGAIGSSLGYLLYWQWPSYAGFVWAELVLALSTSLISGSRDALLFDSLDAHKATDQYIRHQGRQFALGNTSEAIAALLAGIVASQYNIPTVLATQFVIVTLAIPVAWSLNSYNDGNRKTESLISVINYCFRGNKKLRWLNLFTGSVSAATLTMVWFTQPYWREIGVSILYFGILWSTLNLITAGASLIAHVLEKKYRFRILFGGIAIAPLFLYSAVALFSGSLISVALVALFSLLRGISQPLISDYVQRECTTGNRATILSANALVTRLTFSIFSPMLGWVADVWSFSTAFAVSGIVFGVISIIGFFLWLTAIRNQG